MMGHVTDRCSPAYDDDDADTSNQGLLLLAVSRDPVSPESGWPGLRARARVSMQ